MKKKILGLFVCILLIATAIPAVVSLKNNAINSTVPSIPLRSMVANWTEMQKLLASDGAAGDYSGGSVSLDGNTALIGAVWDDDNGVNSGSAYVFTRTGTTWTQQQKLVASDGAAGDAFGCSVSLSGNTALIGAPYDDDNGGDSGSAYVFIKQSENQPPGSIVAWGYNGSGQCNVPCPNSGFISIAGGNEHSLGLKVNGSIVAWGRENTHGECDVPWPNSGFTAVSAGGYHSLGLKVDGSIVAWGGNDYGQCNVPSPNSGFTAVAAGYYHSLGMKADGSIIAWGYNTDGECNVPSPNTDFMAIAAGTKHSVGLKADGSIVAWGNNDFGQCDVPSPNSGFTAVAACGYNSMGLKADGSIVAWGWNDDGQCNVPSPNSGFMAVAAGAGHGLGLKADGSIVSWGSNYHGNCDVPSPNSGFTAIAAGHLHSLGLKAGVPPIDVYVKYNFNSLTPGWGYDHFSSIQAGIDAVAEHGTVYVYSGTYYEHVVISKTLTLIGQDRSTTIIDGGGIGNVVCISVDWVNMSGFNITNSGDSSFDAGIYISSDFNIVIGNNALNNKYGIILFSSSNNVITGNNASNNINGIDLSYSSNNNIVTGNNAHSNIIDGINLMYSSNNNTVKDNNANSNNDFGILLFSSSNNTVTGNNAHSNILRGISLCYFSNDNIVAGNNVSNNYDGILLITSCNNNIVAGNNANSNNYYGIRLFESAENNTIMGNNASNNREGIHLNFSSNNNTVKDNNASNNEIGICLSNTNTNIIKDNNINSNNENGIYLNFSSNNTVTGNNVSNNGCGIFLYFSNNNIIYNNYFSNAINAYDDGNNFWNVSKTPGTNIIGGPYLGGNYWRDYTGADTEGDGLGDTKVPYGPGDYLPLTDINYGPIADADGPYTCELGQTITFDGSKSYDTDGTIVSYQWTFGDGTTGTGVSPTHKYSNYGTYTVTLLVTDDDGATDQDYTTAMVPYRYPPVVHLLYPIGGETLKDTITIKWSAHDTEDGNNLRIYFYYSSDDGRTWSPFTSNPQENTGEYSWDTTKLPDGTYLLQISAKDSDNNFDWDTSDPFQIKNHEEPPKNHEPVKPNQPSGPTNGKKGQEYSYTTSTTDPDGDQVYYLWDWGDGNNSGYLGPYNSGVTISTTHKWAVKGSYSIKVKAKDIYGKESSWSDPLPITMPYSFNRPILQFLELLFQRFSHAFPILRHLLGY